MPPAPPAPVVEPPAKAAAEPEPSEEKRLAKVLSWSIIFFHVVFHVCFCFMLFSFVF